jgi:hypothetical protein
MNKRVQIILDEEAWKIVEDVCSEANENFSLGSVTYSDTINDLILRSKPDVRQLQQKHTDIRRSLKHLAKQKDIDVESAIKALSEMVSKSAKRPARLQLNSEAME